MRLLRYLIIITLCFISFSIAKNHWMIQTGYSKSSFKNSHNFDRITDVHSFWYGIGKEWTFRDNFFLSIECNYIVKGAILKDKSIHPIYDLEPIDVYKYDIECRIGFLEFPLHLKHGFKISNDVQIKLFAGPNLSIPLRDKTKLHQKEIYMHNINPSEYRDRFDYDEWEESGFGNNNKWSSLVYHFGIEIDYKRIGISLKYAHDSRDVWWFGSMSEVFKTMYSYQVSVGIYL